MDKEKIKAELESCKRLLDRQTGKVYKYRELYLQCRDAIKENKKLREYVKDCASSHHETRYKYRAQALLNKIDRPS